MLFARIDDEIVHGHGGEMEKKRKRGGSEGKNGRMERENHERGKMSRKRVEEKFVWLRNEGAKRRRVEKRENEKRKGENVGE